jgi:DNA-binding response OmpR family regulator
MPEMNGYQACRAIKRIDPKICVIILTAKTEAADRFWATQSGADEFLNKPIDPALLVQRIEALLAQPA